MPADTFLFRLAGPMQSWGIESRFLVRDTGTEPSKSAIVGLICAALGKPREENPGDKPRLDELTALKLAVRADREGEVKLDYHTVGGSRSSDNTYGVIRADGSGVGPVVSRRYYLSDAEFLAAVEGERALLETIATGLAAPRWQIFLGRKAFVPATPLILPDAAPWDGGWRRGIGLREAIEFYPWLGQLSPSARAARPNQVRVVADDPEGASARRDFPLSFSPRRFSVRRVSTFEVSLTEKET